MKKNTEKFYFLCQFDWYISNSFRNTFFNTSSAHSNKEKEQRLVGSESE